MKNAFSPSLFIPGDPHLNDLSVLLREIILDLDVHQLVILTDHQTDRLCYPMVQPQLPAGVLCYQHTIPDGEENKDWEMAGHLLQRFLEEGLDKNTLLINLGGGMVSDMGGFVASVFRRGIPFVNVPTTLLSQVDAALGGKNGVNLHGIKNQAGTIHQPVTIYANPLFLKTLPAKEWQSGLGELFKYALIGSGVDFDEIGQIQEGDYSHQAKIIARCLNFKQKITQSDPQERGIRKILNFGHTVGHAIESYALSVGADISHGEAVAAGLVTETYISCLMNGTSDTLLNRVSVFYKTHFTPDLMLLSQSEALIELMRFDKKNAHGDIMMVLLNRMGDPELPVAIKPETIARSIQYLSAF